MMVMEMAMVLAMATFLIRAVYSASSPRASSRDRHGRKPTIYHPDVYRLVLDNLPTIYDWRDLKDFCRVDGADPVFSKLVWHGKHSFGLVDYSSPEAMDIAREKLHGTIFPGSDNPVYARPFEVRINPSVA